MRKNVLDLSSKKANKFFLSPPMYSSIELPPYFTFGSILEFISNHLGGNISKKNELEKAKKIERVNHFIYHNKDGKYAWRKLELLNPYLYISLVNCITEADAWQAIKNRFNELNCSQSFKCMSIPVIADIRRKQNASQASEWIEEVEKESIRLALDFEFLFQTDIVDCYGSIYTHSLSWALHGKLEAKKKRGFDQLLGNKIDCHLQAMSNGQTNGIPQGSKLMDFLAEILLAYIDAQLFKKIAAYKNINTDEYFVLRYRDDYRIFVHNPYHGEIIMKFLSETLAEVGMTMNTSKTKKSEEIIMDSIKPDKFSSLNQPTIQKVDYNSVRNELLFIYKLGIDYPNSGQVVTRLTKVNKLVDSIAHNKILQRYYEEFVSILINIAFDSPRSFPVAAALISKAILKLDTNEKKKIIEKLIKKIELLPNSGILEIWLQRITIKHDIVYGYNEMLCKIVNKEPLKIFDTSWISDAIIKEGLDSLKIINYKTLKNLDKVIDKKEVDLFAY